MIVHELEEKLHIHASRRRCACKLPRPSSYIFKGGPLSFLSCPEVRTLDPHRVHDRTPDDDL